MTLIIEVNKIKDQFWQQENPKSWTMTPISSCWLLHVQAESQRHPKKSDRVNLVKVSYISDIAWSKIKIYWIFTYLSSSSKCENVPENASRSRLFLFQIWLIWHDIILYSLIRQYLDSALKIGKYIFRTIQN